MTAIYKKVIESNNISDLLHRLRNDKNAPIHINVLDQETLDSDLDMEFPEFDDYGEQGRAGAIKDFLSKTYDIEDKDLNDGHLVVIENGEEVASGIYHPIPNSSELEDLLNRAFPNDSYKVL